MSDTQILSDSCACFGCSVLFMVFRFASLFVNNKRQRSRRRSGQKSQSCVSVELALRLSVYVYAIRFNIDAAMIEYGPCSLQILRTHRAFMLSLEFCCCCLSFVLVRPLIYLSIWALRSAYHRYFSCLSMHLHNS